MGAADRVRKLAALAGSDNVHEANEAARQACRLIREGKVTLDDVVDARTSWSDPRRSAAWRPPPPPPPRPRPRPRAPAGGFVRRPGVVGATCVSCREVIDPGDAFACVDGFAHGDCIPAGERP